MILNFLEFILLKLFQAQQILNLANEELNLE